VGWEELNRGRALKAHEAADKLMAVGRRLNDPRSIGYAMALEAWIALTSDDYAGALEFAEKSLSIARAPFERETANVARNAALALLRRPEAPTVLRDYMTLCRINGWHALGSGADGIWGASLVVQEEIGKGIRWIEQAILRREREGYRAAADWCRMFLCEIYLEIVSGNQKLLVRVLLRNIVTLAVVRLTAQRRICALVHQVRHNLQFDPNGHHISRCELILGLLYKAKRRRGLALRHLSEARRIASQFGRTPMLTRIEAALAELA
jgi:hypothetical protein